MMDPLDDVITLEEAAELCGRAEVTLRGAAARGRLRARRLGRGGQRSLWITTRDAVAEYQAWVASSSWSRQPQYRRRIAAERSG